MPLIDPKKTLVTPKGTAVYPKLIEPDTKFNAEGVYSVRLRLDEADEAALIEKLQVMYDDAYVENCKAEKKQKLKKADVPWKPETRKDENDVEVETGAMLFNFKMKASGTSRKTGKKWSKRPSLYDAKGASLMKQADSMKIGGGSKIKVAYTVSSFYTGALGSGISLRLEGVQIIDLVESGNNRSAASMGFGAEEGYSAEDAAAVDMAPAAPDSTGGADKEDF